MPPPASLTNALRLVILDRDGVLNEDLPQSVTSPRELVMIAGSAKAIALLNAAGLHVALCSNQAVVGRGRIRRQELDKIQDKLGDELRSAGAHLDAVFLCTDKPIEEGGNVSTRRKPAPGMLREAMEHFRVRPSQTVMIGDSLSDLQAACAAGVGRILVRSGKGAHTQAQGIDKSLLPVAVHANLEEAVLSLINQSVKKET